MYYGIFDSHFVITPRSGKVMASSV